MLYDRPNLDEHILDGTLEFSDGTRIATKELPNDGEAKVIPLTTDKIVKWVQFTVDRSEGLNIGLMEIEIYQSSHHQLLIPLLYQGDR
jgi:hypothetical protein